jgi:hypothetical protein
VCDSGVAVLSKGADPCAASRADGLAGESGGLGCGDSVPSGDEPPEVLTMAPLALATFTAAVVHGYGGGGGQGAAMAVQGDHDGGR